METPYDIVIIGTGEGSKFLAWTLGKQSKRVAAIERKYIGGSCPKAMLFPCSPSQRHRYPQLGRAKHR
jgi:pyruvate/2-oxoglutarate dehydrogenase complex dihydrolipoamide dehydrogenase (E3) component